MSVYHLHVVTPALILWVVLCALVMMDMYWIVMGCPVTVSKAVLAAIMHLSTLYRTSYCNAAKSNSSIH